jgi:hypothetical protein
MKVLQIAAGEDSFAVKLEDEKTTMRRAIVGCLMATVSCSDRADGRDPFVESRVFADIYGRPHLAAQALARFQHDMANCGPEVVTHLKRKLSQSRRARANP